MKSNNSKGKTLYIIKWCLAVIFALSVIVTGFHWTSIILILSAILMMPIKPIRNILNKVKIKDFIVVIISVILFIFGVVFSPDISKEQHEENTETTTYKAEEISSNSTSENSTSDDNKNDVITLKNIPDFAGKPYVVLNNNVPSFTKSELTTTGYEQYAPLDKLGRCGKALASCGKEIMPKQGEKRKSISKIKPSGWNQARYDCISKQSLYNRCHLIGWQLSAENANKLNLITGTEYLNIKGMLPFENMIADYIKETNNHVAYRVTPIYEGNNLVASGVQMEAISVEDDGDGICFNIYCYNVQPGIVIDYSNGSSHLENEAVTEKINETITEEKPSRVESEQNNITENIVENHKTVYITPTGKCYHYDANCGGKNSKPTSIDNAKKLNLSPCKKCVK